MTEKTSDFLAEQKRLAEAQATAYERMVELGRGVGFLAIKHPEMRDSMEAWMRATENEHADTVLRLIAALEAVHNHAMKERDEIRARYGPSALGYRGYADACDDVIKLLGAALGGEGDE